METSKNGDKWAPFSDNDLKLAFLLPGRFGSKKEQKSLPCTHTKNHTSAQVD
jgi:hypothetical protein